MKTINVGTIEQEGFIQSYILRFDNGLIFRTYGSAHWMGTEKHKEIESKFLETVEYFREIGFEIHDGFGILERIKNRTTENKWEYKK